MADYNYSSPSVVGMQFAPASSRSFNCSSSRGALMRFKSNTTGTPANVHVYVDTISGSPGMGIEITSDAPDDTTVTTYTFYPGTDTGSTTTSYTDQGGATLNYTELNDNSDATYGKTTTSSGTVTFRGADVTGIPAGKRIVSVIFDARIGWSAKPGSGDATSSVKVANRLNLGGTNYDGGTTTWTNSTANATWVQVDQWYMNPSTNSIWTRAEVNNLVSSTATDEWGVRHTSLSRPSGGPEFRIYAMRMRIETAPDNRVGYYVNTTTAPTYGWNKYALTGGAALVSGAWYWVHLWNPGASGSFNVTSVQQTDADIATAAGDTGVDHRRCHKSYTRRSGGLTASPSYSEGVEMLPVLFDIGGSINSQSNPYKSLYGVTLSGGGARAQQVTMPGSTVSVSGVRLVLGWAGTSAPDAPLICQIRSGVGKESGGGSLVATATLNPSRATSSGYNRYTIALNAPFTPSAGTQYALYISSNASSSRGWNLLVGDTGNHLLTGTTAAEVESATQGGSTDTYYTSGSPNTRYETMGAVIMAGPATPGSFTATPTAGS